ncbi:MAG: FAD-dependent oxidoreductase, partial [Lachnospiraceae bacterium]|nr:FAD-dependent oxidoreductase [Lachnospiraceae bacterium]
MAKDISRRDFMKSMAAGTMGAVAAGFLSGSSLYTRAEEASSDSETSVGTRYTKASNPDEIGIVHDAASEEDVDVVVVGSGIGGLVCAMITAEQNPDAKIIIAEARGYCGGGTNFAEQCDMPGTGLDWVSALQYGDEVAAETNFVKNARLNAELKYDLGRNSSWLFTKHAVPLTIRSFERLKSGLDKMENGEAITAWQPIVCYEGGSGALTVKRLVAEIDENETYANVEIRLNTRAIALLQEDEYNVTGVQVLDENDEYVNLNAKAVVLACGGMSNNLELLQNYSNQELSHCISVEQGHNGDGMVMAEQTAHGRAKTIALSSMQAGVDGMHYQSWLNLAVGQTKTTLYVNQEGLRFANEDISRASGEGGVNKSKLIEGEGAVYSILGSNLLEYYKENKVDANSFYGNGQEDREFDLDAELEAYADNENIFTADTIEELAEKIGVSAENLVETVATYDADAAAGTGESVVGVAAYYVVAIGGAPYYAFKLKSIIVNTNAGVRVDHDCRVVDQDYNPVNGLYAAGLTISGFVTDVYE